MYNTTNIELCCSFFVMPRNGPAFLGMPYCGKLQLLSVDFDAINVGQKKEQINEQSRQDK